MTTNDASPIHESCMGHCSACGVIHSLPVGNTRVLARQVMDEFRRIRRLDYKVSESAADPGLSFDHLFPGDRGHMFGVMECVDRRGNPVVLRAFSSLRGGIRSIDGWVPPIHSDEMWENVVLPTQAKIKAFTQIMKREKPQSPAYTKLFEARKKISRELVSQVQEQLLLTNFRGEKRHLKDAHHRPNGIPGGVGDCCGPKLLNHAALNDLKPLGLSEFHWGESTPNGSKVHGRFYPCCQEKCQSILGFMLCGIDELF